MEYEYFIQRINVLHKREGPQLEEDYKKYVQKFASEGWRFVQLIDLTTLESKDLHIDLLFEREKGGS